ncbi:MAG: ABC transporter ATP-binding protein [Thaumarchaeota archaeon]|nr:ABC transporter ATP-binding protein [Candidatus Calditenuaceae archaeon]MDW8187146.1 ABC transporter ATP-binding protein [Nitrososphaerota archaeon]
MSGASLEVRNLNLTFGKVKAVDNVSLDIRAGERLAVIGPNGAGKTSLMNCVNGFYRPQSGTISLNGVDITRLPPPLRARKGISRTFQNVQLYKHETVLENVRAAYSAFTSLNPISILSKFVWYGPGSREEHGIYERAEEVIDFLELWEYRNTHVINLPLGLQRRVELARALALDPKLLLLDEVMSGLTFDEKYDMVRFILDINEERGVTVVLVEHDLKVVMEVCPRIVVMHQGQVIADGSPGEISLAPRVLEAYLGV